MIHGHHDEWDQMFGDIRSGLGAEREAVDEGNGDGNEGN